MSTEKQWWEPVLADAEYCKRIREDYPEKAAEWDDETIIDYYADGWKYATTWDNVKDARENWEYLADAYLALKDEHATLRQAQHEATWAMAMEAACKYHQECIDKFKDDDERSNFWEIEEHAKEIKRLRALACPPLQTTNEESD